ELEAWPTEYQSSGTLSRTFVNPLPGVWEVVVENENENRALAQPQVAEPPPATFTLTASLYQVDATPTVIKLDPSLRGERIIVDASFTNRYAPFRGAISDAPLGSAYSDHPILQEGSFKVYEIEVVPGTRTLNARIGGAADPKADLDLYLFNCSAK